jgi:hypothetical protein
MDDQQLGQFLAAAKRTTYAARGDDASENPLLPGSRQLEYQLGDVLYRDIYFGGEYFVGQETVYVGDTPIWAMGYAGGILGENRNVPAIYDFLRYALRQADPAAPYRGPGLIRRDLYQYTSQTGGDLGNFWGVERISSPNGIVYELRYHGGRIR